MAAPYRLYGAELSPYSIKVRQVLRYKKVPHQWLARTIARQAEFQRFAKLPLVPVLVGADDYSMQDSTPIIETLERRYPEPTITPDDPGAAFLSAVIEDFADEWVNKLMFHFRWSQDADQESAARRIVEGMESGQEPAEIDAATAQIRERMVSRLHLVGSGPDNAPLIEAALHRLIACLEPVLAARPYLFGGRPSIGDFGLGAQLGQMATDPTAGALLRASGPSILAWVARLEAEEPAAEGEFLALADAAPALEALFRNEIAGCYLPWMAANAIAAEDGGAVEAAVEGGVFRQSVQKYAARAFGDLRRKRAGLTDDAITDFLAATGCDAWLQRPASEAGDAAGDRDGDEGDEDRRDGGAEAEEDRGRDDDSEA